MMKYALVSTVDGRHGVWLADDEHGARQLFRDFVREWEPDVVDQHGSRSPIDPDEKCFHDLDEKVCDALGASEWLFVQEVDKPPAYWLGSLSEESREI